MRRQGALTKKRGWPIALAALLLVVIGGSFVAAVFSSRQVQGSIPGDAAILGLAVMPSGLLIGTADGALSSPDGTRWSRVPGFRGTTLVANRGAGALLVSGGRTFETRNLTTFTALGEAVDGAVSVAGSTDEVYFATGTGHFFRSTGGAEPVEIPGRDGPGDVVTLAAAETSPRFLAGGLTSGLWLSEDGGLAWIRLLGTPTRSALVDHRQPGRSFIATAGGVLTSADGRQWNFTDLRERVEALAQTPDFYFAIAASRLLYQSSDGLTWQAKTLAE